MADVQQVLTAEILRLSSRLAASLIALGRIADMRDAEGNPIEMHRDELRGIARAAVSEAEKS